MTRRLTTALVVLVPLVLAPAASATTSTTNVPATLGSRVDKAAARSGARVLLPSRITTEFERLYPSGSWRRGHYDLELGAAKGCNGATACFVAAFLGDRNATPSGPRRVALAGGRTGYFTPIRCGASCAAPQIQWREHGVRYTIQAKGGTAKTDRARLVAMANSAIRHGAR